MKIKGVMFDDHGTTYSVNNVDIYVGEIKDELLVKTYISTVYFHNLTLVMEKLVEKGYAKEGKVDETYDSKLGENAIESMKEEIIERFDEEYHDYVYNKIDLSFLDKKPKEL